MDQILIMKPINMAYGVHFIEKCNVFNRKGALSDGKKWAFQNKYKYVQSANLV